MGRSPIYLCTNSLLTTALTNAIAEQQRLATVVSAIVQGQAGIGPQAPATPQVPEGVAADDAETIAGSPQHGAGAEG